MVQKPPQCSIRANTQCCLTLPSRGTSRAGALGRLMSNVKHRGKRSSKYRLNYREVVGVIERHLEPTLLAVHLYGSRSGWRPPRSHSDIDLLVTVTVRLDETTRRALINDLLETSASWRARFSAVITIVVHDDIPHSVAIIS